MIVRSQIRVSRKDLQNRKPKEQVKILIKMNPFICYFMCECVNIERNHQGNITDESMEASE